MNHINLFEFNELSWFPKIWRDLFTDALSYFIAKKKLYVPIADLLKPLIEKNRDFAIVDFCSGAAIPITTIINSFNNNIVNKIQILLTDKFPNISAFTQISKESNGKITFIDKSIDATNVPENLQGFRTFFSSFHHFNEESALAILSDAVSKRQGIGIFEFTERSLLLRLLIFFIPLQVFWVNTPLIRPFCWQRILWTYLIPIVPIMFFFDGFVSCLRTYSEIELTKFITKFKDCRYTWKIGRIKSTRPFYITYLIGYPLEKI